MSPRPALRRAIVASALLSLPLLLTGCGGEAESEAASSSEAAQGEGSSEVSSETEAAGNQDPSAEAADNSADEAVAKETTSPDTAVAESDTAGGPAVVVPPEILEAAAVPSLGNLTSLTQRGNGSEAIWALRYGLGSNSWEKTCTEYGESLTKLGFDEAISEQNSLYASGTYLGKKHSVSYSCEKGSMVVLVGPGW